MMRPNLLAGLGVIAMPAVAAGPDLNLLTTFTSLIMVLVVIGLLAWLMKRMQLPQLAGQGKGLRVVRQLSVGQKERVVVVEVGDEQVLLGVTPQQVNLLKVLEQPLEEAPPAEFAAHLSKLMKKNDAK